MKTKTVIAVGFLVSPEVAKRLCDRLDLACEIAKGNFTWEHEGQCTNFIAPRQLGDNSYRIAQAVVNGFRIGVLWGS